MMWRKSIANAVGGKTARACDSCVRKRARWYCAADDAFLCQSCDSAVHSANPLARRHQRIRLNSASSNSNNKLPSPSWVSGFTRKPRSRRPPPPPALPKSDDLISLLSNPSFSLVPEADEATSNEDNNEEDQLLYRVPTFDPFLDGSQSKSLADDQSTSMSANLHGFLLPSDDLDLADFAADVESLLGRNLESECFDMEGLGLGLGMALDKDDDTSTSRVKVEADHQEKQGGAAYCRVQQQFEAEVDVMREPFQFNLDDYDDHEDKKVPVVSVKNETEEDCAVLEEDEEYESLKTKEKKRKLMLRLDCDAVIAAWGNDKSPWTTGERPHFDPYQAWPNCMAVCGGSYGHTCGEYGLSTAAMGDGGREARVSRYREKRRTRLFSKKIRYEVRKLNAEKRPRMKGRFVKRTPFAQTTLPIITIK